MTVAEPDPEVAAAIAALFAGGGAEPEPGDWRTRRETYLVLGELSSRVPRADGVTVSSHSVPVPGAELELREYAPAGHDDAAVLYLHGGGMILGSLEDYDGFVHAYAAESGVRMLAVEYRLAPEHAGTGPVEDCAAALAWLVARAPRLGIDPARIAVMGDSAGGGLAAGVALLARERGLPLAAQLLIYPMLDDRTVDPDPALAGLTTWSYADNATGWSALLGAARGTEDVPPAAAPARATDLSGLPPAYVEVGAHDLFRDEDVAYARRLSAAGVPVELHVVPGVPHGFELFAPEAAVSRAARARRIAVIRSL